MNTELWQRLKEVFERAEELPAGERAAFVERSCNGNQELQREVMELLSAADEVEETFLGRPMAERALNLLGSGRRPAMAGRQIGRWRLVERIGGGGMGVVYLAERTSGGFRQQGALKMIAGLPGRELQRRLEEERQMLAGLSHPGIARLLDGGSTEDGYPFLVMEYVRGQTITDYCDERRLTIDERIALVLAICSAVQSAHQSLIIHRDLKPSNILVTGDGTPKLLDFGIAKLLEEDVAADGETRGAALTPGYASPEQLHHRPVSTASDVFALGVLLYELLTDRRPFGPTGAPLPEIARRMEAGPPFPPSVVLGQPGGEGGRHPEKVARARRLTPAALRRRLRGDLDAIVLKALRVEPEWRYPTVEALAEELRRERDGQPVAARGGALAYRALRFIRRHRVALAAAALVAISLVVAVAVSWSQAQTARRALAKAERVSSALERILWSPNPDWYANGGSTETTMATVLKAAGQWLPEALADLPEEEARMRYSLGTTLAALGELEGAEAELRQARDLYLRLWGRDHVEAAKATAALGGVIEMRGRHLEAADEFRSVLETCGRADCEAFLDYLVPGTYWALGLSLMAVGEDAEATLQKGLDLRRAQGYGEDALSANLLVALGKVHANRGDLAAARGLFGRALVFAQGVQRAGALVELAGIHELDGRLVEARQELDEARQIVLDARGPRHFGLGLVETQLAHLELSAGAVAAARRRIGDALTLLRDSRGHDRLSEAWARAVHGEILMTAGELESAELELASAVELLAVELWPGSWRLGEARSLLGACLAARGRQEEGEVLLSAGRRVLEEALGFDDPRARRARQRQATATGDPP